MREWIGKRVPRGGEYNVVSTQGVPVRCGVWRIFSSAGRLKKHGDYDTVGRCDDDHLCGRAV